MLLWLQTHFAGTTCVVVCNPTDYIDLIARTFRLTKDEKVDLVYGQYFIYPVSHGPERAQHASELCNSLPNSEPYAMVWDGKSITDENT